MLLYGKGKEKRNIGSVTCAWYFGEISCFFYLKEKNHLFALLSQPNVDPLNLMSFVGAEQWIYGGLLKKPAFKGKSFEEIMSSMFYKALGKVGTKGKAVKITVISRSLLWKLFYLALSFKIISQNFAIRSDTMDFCKWIRNARWKQ